MNKYKKILKEIEYILNNFQDYSNEIEIDTHTFDYDLSYDIRNDLFSLQYKHYIKTEKYYSDNEDHYKIITFVGDKYFDNFDDVKKYLSIIKRLVEELK